MHMGVICQDIEVCCQAALINGENRIGLCIHKMIGGELDSGPIISRSYFEANINTRIGGL